MGFNSALKGLISETELIWITDTNVLLCFGSVCSYILYSLFWQFVSASYRNIQFILILTVFVYRKSAIFYIISDRSVRITFLPRFGQINRHTPVPFHHHHHVAEGLGMFLFHSARGAHPYRKACRSRGVKVAAPLLDSPCDWPVTYPGDAKILVKSSKRRSGPAPFAITKQVLVAAWHKAAHSYVVPLPTTHRFVAIRSIRSVQLLGFHTSYSYTCYQVLIRRITRSLGVCQPSLYCTNFFTKTVEKSSHRAVLIRVLALYLEGLGFQSRTKERVTGMWVWLLLFFLPSQILCQYIQFIRFVYLFISYLTMLSVGQYIACLYCLYTKYSNKQHRGWFIAIWRVKYCICLQRH